MSANLENSAVATGLEKGQSAFQSQRRAMPKNVQTTVQLCSFLTMFQLDGTVFLYFIQGLYTSWSAKSSGP